MPLIEHVKREILAGCQEEKIVIAEEMAECRTCSNNRISKITAMAITGITRATVS